MNINDKHTNQLDELFTEIAIVHEDCDSLSEILALEKKFNELKIMQPNYEYIPVMKRWLKEAKENVKKYNEFSTIRAEIFEDTGDKYLAEDMAFELVYAE